VYLTGELPRGTLRSKRFSERNSVDMIGVIVSHITGPKHPDPEAPMTVLSRSTLAVALLVISTAPPAVASESVTRTRMLAAENIASIVVEAAVGEVRIEPGESDAIEARVTLIAKRNTGIGALPDVSTLQMSATTRGDQLRLEVDSKNIEERWVLRLPKKVFSALEAKLGVGEVKITVPARRIEVDLGVGDARVDAASGAISVRVGTGNAEIRTTRENVGTVEGTTGVGGLTVTGVDGTVDRHWVGGSIAGKGRGREPIEVTVGVGDLTVTLTD
jgi:hypothetical protein